jgi:hypothetical protein
MTARWSLVLLALLFGATSPPAAIGGDETPAISIVTILQSGDPAPGLDGNVIHLVLGAPVVNARGDVGFTATVAPAGEPMAKRHAFLLEPSREGVVLLVEGSPVPGFPDDRVGSLAGPRLAPDGWALLPIPVLSKGENWEWKPEQIVLVPPDGKAEGFARVGAITPDLKAVIDEIQGTGLGEGGRFTLRAMLRDADGRTAAVFRGDRGNGLRLLAREGAPAPGLPAGTVVRWLPYRAPAVGPGGVVAFTADVTAPDGERQDVLYRAAWAGEVGIVARSGDPAGPGEATLDEITSAGIGTDGAVTFRASFEGSVEEGVFAAAPGQPPRLLALVNRVETEGPAGVPHLDAPGLTEVLVVDGGRIVGTGYREAPGAEEYACALYAADSGGRFRVLQSEGEAAPGLPGRVFLGEVASFHASPGGVVSFLACFDEEVEGVRRRGLWLAGPDGPARLVVAEGRPLDLGGVSRTVKKIDLAGGAGQPPSNGFDGHPCPVSPAGQVFFQLTFEDGSTGLHAASNRKIREE